MKRTIVRRPPILLLRDARGRFARLRVPLPRRVRRPRRPVLRLAAPIATQLALF